MNTRRELLIALGASAFVAPLVAIAQQQGRVWRVGLLDYSRPDVERIHLWDVFRQRLRELGYFEGENITFEPRWAEGNADRLPALAAGLVKLKVDVIATASTPAAQAAKSATTTIPIVMATGSDPVRVGLVASLSRPGGNVTGIATLDSDLQPKRLELLREMIPSISRVAILVDPNSPSSTQRHETEQAGKALGISVLAVSARSTEEFERAFKSMLQPRVDALIIQPSAMFSGERSRLADLAMKFRIPTATIERAYAEAGCLMSYGTDFANNFRHAAEHIAKILGGASPADLPFEQPTRIELVINLKTARALGVTVPQPLLLRADDVIQ